MAKSDYRDGCIPKMIILTCAVNSIVAERELITMVPTGQSPVKPDGTQLVGSRFLCGYRILMLRIRKFQRVTCTPWG